MVEKVKTISPIAIPPPWNVTNMIFAEFNLDNKIWVMRGGNDTICNQVYL